MKTRALYFLALVLFGLTISFNSCKDDELTPNQTAIAAAEDDLIVNESFDQIFEEVDDAVGKEFGGLKTGTLDECPVRTVDRPNDTQYPKVVTVDFGESCIKNEIVKSGKLIVKLTDNYKKVGSQRIVTFENFKINGRSVTGTKTVTFKGLNENNQPWFTVELKDMKITFANGKQVTRNASKNFTKTAGADTPLLIWDDEYLITGSANGINRNGKNYTMTITTPLHRQLGCRWIKSGVKEFDIDSQKVVIDYGNDACDNIVTITVNGETKEVKIKN